MDAEMRVLDKGYVKLLNVQGPVNSWRVFAESPELPSLSEFATENLERAPAQSARVSFDRRGDRTLDEDMKLNSFLWKNDHTSPFEMVETWWEVKCPIFVARQWVRHRTASMNEVSGRYVDLGGERGEDIYVPDPEKVGKPAGKQGRVIDENDTYMTHHTGWITYQKSVKYAFDMYKNLLSEGWPKELARGVLPVATYTKFLWKQDLKNLMHLIMLREEEHAQWEFQEYARAMRKQLEARMPKLMEVMSSD